MSDYLHGYSSREARRLREQSGILEELLHGGTRFPPGSKVLEAGCGVGAQTAILSRRNPGAEITCIDKNPLSLELARHHMSELGARDIRFRQEDISKLSLDAEQFDHVFICFVLEHLPEPIEALRELRRVLKPGGTITVIEGDHGSALWRPLTPESTTVWNALIAAQTQMGYDPLIGRSLFPLLNKAGFALPSVEPRSVYADAANPELLDGVVSKIIVPMVETARLRAMESRVVDSTVWRRGIAGLERAGHPPDGTFFYSWFKGTATKQEINGEQYPKT